jgi:hypothetical protein
LPHIQENLLQIEPAPIDLAEPGDEIAWALAKFRSSERNVEYQEARDYFEGDHRLAFATDKFKTTFGKLFQAFADNLCPAVVSALGDRLMLRSFKSSRAEMKIEDVPSKVPGVPPRQQVNTEDPLGERAWEIWKANKMDLKAREIHEEALIMRESFVIVWPDESGFPAIFPQTSEEIVVEYDVDNPGVMSRAAKMWALEDGRLRLNLYYRDRIEKYVTTKKKPNGIPRKIDEFEPYDDGFGNVVPNPYDVVPVFHFENPGGHSELKDVIPIQDALNKTVADMMVAMEFAAFKQRYIIGMEADLDPESGEPTAEWMRKTGVDRMIAIPNDEAKVGQFDSTDLGQFIRVAEQFRHEVARVSGTPLHYFLIVEGDFPSGEAMKSAEARFVKRIEDRQIAFGHVWESVMSFCLFIAGDITPDDYFARGEEKFYFESQWKDASPRSEAEIADTAVKKKAVGVSDSQLLMELGYDADTIRRMLEERAAQQVMQQVLAPNPGRPAADEQPGGQRGNGVNPSTKQPPKSGAPSSRQQPNTA